MPRSPNHRYPLLASQQPYIECLLEGFNFCLSPQQLPHNMSARNFMDEELWMPIRALSKLPELDSLFISEIMIPFIVDVLHNYSRDTMEVDLTREMVRPKWALQSSVFISKVDENATTEQIYALLDDIRLTILHHTNPYEYRNITIAKQSPNAWTVGFKSPSAGAYAAMVLRTKCINGSMILPMACVYIKPPRASYIYAGIVVMEIDPVQFGAPFIPNELVPYYSENPQHTDMLYWQTAPHHFAPPYQAIFHEAPNTVWKSSGRAEPKLSEWRGGLQGGGHKPYSGSEVQTIRTSTSSGKQTKSDREPYRHVTKSEAVPAIGNSIKKKEPRDARSDQELLKNWSLLELKSSKFGHERLSQPPEKIWRSDDLLPQHRSQIEKGTRGSDASDSHGDTLNTAIAANRGKGDKAVLFKNVLKEENGERVELFDSPTVDEIRLDDDTEGPIRFPNPESVSLPSPSFVTNVRNGESRDVAGQQQMPKAELVLGGHFSHDGRGRTPKSHIDVRALGNTENGVQRTHLGRKFRGGNPTVDQRRHAGQQRSYQNGRQHYRRGPHSHVEQRNSDTFRYRSNSSRRRYHHQRQRSRDSENNRGRQLLASHSTGGIRNSLAHFEAAGSGGDRQLCCRNQSTEKAEEWQVISYRKPVQRSRSWRSPAGSGGASAGKGDRGGRRYGPSSNLIV